MENFIQIIMHDEIYVRLIPRICILDTRKYSKNQVGEIILSFGGKIKNKKIKQYCWVT